MNFEQVNRHLEGRTRIGHKKGPLSMPKDYIASELSHSVTLLSQHQASIFGSAYDWMMDSKLSGISPEQDYSQLVHCSRPGELFSPIPHRHHQTSTMITPQRAYTQYSSEICPVRSDFQSRPSSDFHPGGLLGDHYDTLKSQMELRHREEREVQEPPFATGLLSLLMSHEASQRTEVPGLCGVGRGQATASRCTRMAYEEKRQPPTTTTCLPPKQSKGANMLDAKIPRHHHVQSRDTNRLLTRSQSLSIPATNASWRDRSGHGVRVPPGVPLVSMAKNARK